MANWTKIKTIQVDALISTNKDKDVENKCVYKH